MKKVVGATLFAAGLALAGCGDSPEQHPSPEETEQNIPTTTPEFAAKVATFNEMLSQATEIVEDTESATGREVLDFLLSRGVLVDPVTNESLHLNGIDQPDSALPIYYLDAQDQENPLYAEYINFNSQTAYDPANRLIVITNKQELGMQTQALLLLHEVFHAKDYYDQDFTYDYEDSRVRAEREIDAYFFQGELMRSLGGTTYEDYLARVSEYLRPALGNNSQTIDSIARIYEHEELGPTGLATPMSQNELYEQTNFSGSYATLQLLAELPDAHALQVQFLQDLYSYQPD